MFFWFNYKRFANNLHDVTYMIQSSGRNRKSIVYFYPLAEKEFRKFGLKVRYKFLDLITELEFESFLVFPYGRKIKGIKENLFEIRVRHDKNIYRAIYAELKKSELIILVCFQKKSQKISGKYINLAIKRLKKI